MVTTPLTRREAEIIAAIADGEFSKEIAHRLGLSHRTIEVHLLNIRRKTGARTTAQAAVMFATRRIAVTRLLKAA